MIDGGRRLLRSFIAFKPPEVICRHIGQVQAQLRSAGVGARWVKPSNIHLTLKFLRETEPERAEDIRAAMHTATVGQRPLELGLGTLGGFPHLGRPRVLWQAVTQETDRLRAIQQRLEIALARFGFQPERRPYRAHLTIGRIRDPKRWRPKSAATVENFAVEAQPPFTLDTLIWYQSRLLPGGAQYTALASMRLGRD